MFQVSWPFGSGEEANNSFSRQRSSWISNRNHFSYFLSISHPDASYFVSNQWPYSSGEETKIHFQDGRHLGFPIGKILAVFDPQVTPMLPTKFQVSWLFGSEEEAKNRFSRWRSWRPSWIFDWNDFTYF